MKKSLLQKVQELIPDGKFKGLSQLLEPHELPLIEMKKINLIVEKSEDDDVLWGRVHYENNLLVDSANTEDVLQENMKILLKDFHDLAPETITFEVSYEAP
jgi:hypothetical protein